MHLWLLCFVFSLDFCQAAFLEEKNNWFHKYQNEK